MKAINVMLAILVSLMIALSVFEGGLRLLGMGPPSLIVSNGWIWPCPSLFNTWEGPYASAHGLCTG